jgi:hypothetical protein
MRPTAEQVILAAILHGLRGFARDACNVAVWTPTSRAVHVESLNLDTHLKPKRSPVVGSASDVARDGISVATIHL